MPSIMDYILSVVEVEVLGISIDQLEYELQNTPVDLKSLARAQGFNCVADFLSLCPDLIVRGKTFVHAKNRVPETAHIVEMLRMEAGIYHMRNLSDEELQDFGIVYDDCDRDRASSCGPPALVDSDPSSECSDAPAIQTINAGPKNDDRPVVINPLTGRSRPCRFLKSRSTAASVVTSTVEELSVETSSAVYEDHVTLGNDDTDDGIPSTPRASPSLHGSQSTLVASDVAEVKEDSPKTQASHPSNLCSDSTQTDLPTVSDPPSAPTPPPATAQASETTNNTDSVVNVPADSQPTLATGQASSVTQATETVKISSSQGTQAAPPTSNHSLPSMWPSTSHHRNLPTQTGQLNLFSKNLFQYTLPPNSRIACSVTDLHVDPGSFDVAPKVRPRFPSFIMPSLQLSVLSPSRMISKILFRKDNVILNNDCVLVIPSEVFVQSLASFVAAPNITFASEQACHWTIQMRSHMSWTSSRHFFQFCQSVRVEGDFFAEEFFALMGFIDSPSIQCLTIGSCFPGGSMFDYAAQIPILHNVHTLKIDGQRFLNPSFGQFVTALVLSRKMTFTMTFTGRFTSNTKESVQSLVEKISGVTLSASTSLFISDLLCSVLSHNLLRECGFAGPQVLYVYSEIGVSCMPYIAYTYTYGQKKITFAFPCLS